MGRWYYPEYVSVAQKKGKAEKKLKELMKKNPGMKPLLLEGSAIAKSWWGKSWNKNLERYADYSNRIGRGRSYVRSGAVLDLQITPGQVESLVQGSSSNPYSITIKIGKLKAGILEKIKTTCSEKLESLQELLSGKFPKVLEEIFLKKDEGLFPSPSEIVFNCSCPDMASMCKHVAATLYGVGARLDESPELFFNLRKIEMENLVSLAVKDKTKKMLEKAEKKSSRIISGADLSSVFGIDLEVSKPEKDEQKKEVTVKKTQKVNNSEAGNKVEVRKKARATKKGEIKTKKIVKAKAAKMMKAKTKSKTKTIKKTKMTAPGIKMKPKSETASAIKSKKK
jgi:uncharacterized Zn finger protein